MALTDLFPSLPFNIPSLGPFTALSAPPTQPPLLGNLPTATRALQRKYADPQMQLALQAVPGPVRQSLLNLDLQRVQRGQNPLSTDQTVGGLSTVLKKQPYTPPEPEGILGRLGADVRALVDIPNLVKGFVGEVAALPQAPEALGKAMAQPFPANIAALQTVPGVRDIPGVFTASQVAKAGPGGLLEHPLFTALDVLPYAKQPIGNLAEATVANKAVLPETAARIEQYRPQMEAIRGIENVRRQATGLPQLPEIPSNLSIAAAVSPTLQPILASAPVTQFQRLMGKSIGDTAQLASAEESRLRSANNPDLPLTHPAIEDMNRVVAEQKRNMAAFEKALTPERRTQLSTVAALDGLPAARQLARTDTERAFLSTAKDAADAISQVAEAHDWGLKQLDGDFFSTDQANKIISARRGRDLQRLVSAPLNAARSWLDTSTPSTTGGAFPSLDLNALKAEGLGADGVKGLARSYAAQIDQAGYDNAAVLSAAQGDHPSPQAIADAVTQSQANPIARPIFTIQELLNDKLKPWVDQENRNQPPELNIGTAHATTYDLLKRGYYKDARDKFSQTVAQRTRFGRPDAPEILDSLRRYANQDELLSTTERRYGGQFLTKAEKEAAAAEAQNLPARFIPKVEQLVTKKLYEMHTSPHDVAMLNRGPAFWKRVSAIHDDPELLNQYFREAQDEVLRMKNEGFDPLYIHKVSPTQIPEAIFPRLSDVLKLPGFTKEATYNFSPWIQDAAVGVSHQAAQALSRLHNERFIRNFLDLRGRTYEEIQDQLLPAAESAAARNPKSLGVSAEFDKLFKKRFKEYDPQDIVGPTRQPHATVFPPKDGRYITHAEEQMLRDMFKEPSKFTSAMTPIMNLFRMSVLAFSPRFQANNLAGGAILTGTQEPRTILTALTQMRRIRDFLRNDEMAKIPGMTPQGFGGGQIPNELNYYMDHAGTLQHYMAAHQWLGGRTLRRWVDEAQAGRGPLRNLISVNGRPSVPRRMADFSYRINGIVDDFYRATAYLTGHDQEMARLVKEGKVTGDEAARMAQQKGVALVRKVLPEWDRISPLERNVVRNIFPFYTFSKFLVRYALQYPFDHPLRVSVMSKLAANEMNDRGNWEPNRFQQMFHIGSPDKNGNVWAVDTQGLNPFTDIANYFHLNGYVGKVNPLISAVLQTAGINPATGTQDLYPDIAYNAQTGTLQPRNTNLLSNLLTSVVPQTNVINTVIGRNENFKSILRADPEQAAAYLRSQLGFPGAVPRRINPAQAAIKAEVARQALRDQVRNDALKTGDWSRAMRFPTLRPLFERLGQLMQSNPDLFSAYQNQIAQARQSSGTGQALVGSVVPGQA